LPAQFGLRDFALAADPHAGSIVAANAIGGPNHRRAAVVTIAPIHTDGAARTRASSVISAARADDGIRLNRQSRHQTDRQHCVCDDFHLIVPSSPLQPSRVRGGLPSSPIFPAQQL
jgi:hypothetical protein